LDHVEKREDISVANTWDHGRAVEHIKAKIADVKTVTIKDYVRDMSLENIKTNEAYRVDGVHLYADILNMDEILGTTQTEGEVSHKRTLRFLNQHYRAASRILNETSAKRVDFHNQRLHAVIPKPYNTETDAEASRVHQAVAIAQLLIDVLQETGDANEKIPSAVVRVGIDTGKALAVNNGRNGYREPLFLGQPANHAAKHSVGTTAGIYLTAEARAAVKLSKVDDTKNTALTEKEIQASQEKAKLSVTKDSIVKEWKEYEKEHPIGEFQFSRQTPPLKDMEITCLTPKNSKRQDATSIYADIDGFTKYVSDHVDENPEDVVRTLHVIRAELERVLTSEFGGRRIRFIGDCVHGLLCEGTSQTTDTQKTISSTVLCAGGLRSSFDEALNQLAIEKVETGKLGLAIGFEFGPMSITRLGIQGDRVRCAVSRGVLQAEEEQCRCKGDETAIGQKAYDKGTDAVRKCFGTTRIKANLDYNEAVEALTEKGDETAEKARSAVITVSAAAGSSSTQVRPFVSL
jgi:class 3 adenylate cyclase